MTQFLDINQRIDFYTQYFAMFFKIYCIYLKLNPYFIYVVLSRNHTKSERLRISLNSISNTCIGTFENM